MSDWKIIVPEATTNELLNPSFEVNITDGWANVDTGAGAVFARDTARARFGVASAQITAGNAVAYLEATLFSLPNNSTVYAQAYVYTDGGAGDAALRIQDSTTPADRGTVANTVVNGWELLQVSWTNTTGGAVNINIQIRNTAADSVTNVWCDAIQAEIDTTTYTTYCDGDQPGCEWNGLPHNSSSQRSGVSRAGGLIRDLQNNYNFEVGGLIGTGMAPLDLAIDQYAILPGGQLNSIKVLSSMFTLTGIIRGASILNLHANRQALLNVLKPDAVPETAEGAQPVILRYTGAAVDKEISVHYVTGLEANIVAEMECWEPDFAIRFTAPNPFWSEIGESARILDTEDTATFRIVAGRLRATGQWDDLGPPNVAGTYTFVNDIVVGPDGLVYFGGDFENFNNIPAADYIVSYDPQTGTWAALDIGLNDIVHALAFGPDGMLYIGGEFTAAGGDGQADYFCTWDGAVFNNLGDPDVGGAVINRVFDITLGHNGDIYVGGDFDDWANAAGADNIVVWDLSAGAWVAVAGGCNDDVYAIKLAPNGDMYIGGLFTDYGGANGDRIVRYDGAAIYPLSTGLGADYVAAIAISDDGTVYLAHIVGGVSHVYEWNGVAFTSLGALAGGIPVGAMLMSPDDILYVGGTFATLGRVKWNGSSWSALDTDIPTAGSSIYAFAFGPIDPVVPVNFDIWLGFNTTVARDFAGSTIVANDGTRTVFPLLVISRIGGTSAAIEQVRNETTGKELLFDYDLLIGETLTIDLRPTRKSIMSNFFGPRPDAIYALSDFGTWSLLPGNNQVTCFVDVVGADIEAYLLWKDTYWSSD